MDILSEINELKEVHIKLEGDYKAATELLEVGAEELQSVKAQLAAKESERAELVNSFTAKLIEAKDALQAANARIVELEAKDKTAEQKAVQIVANQGIAPMAVVTSGAEVLTKIEALKAYEALLSISPQQAGDYFAKNRDILIK